MVIDCTGIRPAPSKLTAVSAMPRPKNARELRAFLGLTGYLRQFVPRYSILAAPLTDLLRNKSLASRNARKLPIEWGGPQEAAFAQLRNAISSPTILAFPDASDSRQF